MTQSTFDAIVVGSGMTGGWAAMELSRAGLNTLVLEAGRNINPVPDYGEHVPPWQMKFRGLRDRREQAARQAVQRDCYACDEVASKFFVDDVDNPYSTPEDAPFRWIRGRQVGGRSIMWARQVYRLSDLDFEANLRDGVGIDWPIRYRDLEPWYDHVERFIGVSGQAEGLAHLPDMQFLPPMELNCVERHVRNGLRRLMDRTLTIGRSAVLTAPHQGRSPCHYCGPCHRGCVTRSYFSSVNATLPAAQATGRMTLRSNSVVRRISYDAGSGRASGVEVIDAVTGSEVWFQARVIFLCASALESTRLLMLSANSTFPDGLANSSGALGRYLMDHTMSVGATAEFPQFNDSGYSGRRPNGIYLARFRNVSDSHAAFQRGYAFQGEAFRPDWARGAVQPGVGEDLKRRLQTPGTWKMLLEGYGECLPDERNQVTLDDDRVDAWGIPTLRIDCRWRENEDAIMSEIPIESAEMLEAVGGRNIELMTERTPPGLTIHEMGTARMGRDPNTSVLNGSNQCHDVPNVFVTDGACMTSSACQNPSLTYMALTARAVDAAVNMMRRNEL